jgi:hypothetical protein
MGGVVHIESFNLEGGKHGLESWEVTLEDHLTGLAILRREEIDLKRRGRLGNSINGERKEKEDIDVNKTLSHSSPLCPVESPTIYSGDEAKNVHSLLRMGSKAPSFLTGFA